MNFEQTSVDAVKTWDDGGTLWSVEMGGLGPGYEQCIQVAAIEILRAAISIPEKINEAKSFEEVADRTIHEIDDDLGGMSGAQAGAATSIAWRAYTLGWGGMLKSAKDAKLEDDRFIQISSHFPHIK